MVRIHRLIAAAATLAALSVAAPAGAKTAEIALYAGSADLTRIATKVCLVAPASRGCTDHQANVIRTAGAKALASQAHASVEEVGRQQLDALIASLD